MSRITLNMYNAMAAIAKGHTVPEAAVAHGVSEQGLYRALSRGMPRCPTCGMKQRRSARGLARDYAAMTKN